MKMRIEEAAIEFGVSREILMQYAFNRKLPVTVGEDGTVLVEKSAIISLLNGFSDVNETQLLVE